MIHIYTAQKSWNLEGPVFKLLCSGLWVGYAEPRRWSSREPKEFVTQPWNSTCPDCLAIAIPKLEDNLARTKEAKVLADAKENPEG